ncbi:MAG: DUF4982 domain-containing protein [Bacteroidales bacterium]|nr:DUF4982 domain-containing protein [Bacteroidales bacterium]MBN2698291.1 DUF4982 domain-containing protein [Bacteroidales bacterium]
MRTRHYGLLMAIFIIFFTGCNSDSHLPGQRISFNEDWKFHLGDIADGQVPELDDSGWRELDLPHDWSIEGPFSEEHNTTINQGALPAGIGWYRKTFRLPESDRNRFFYIGFDGIYRNSQVWINGHLLGERPSGYISFRYDLTPYLNYGKEENMIAVKADNLLQPCSRWYTGSGIYRNVWIVKTGEVHVDHWGTFVRTRMDDNAGCSVDLDINIRNRTEKYNRASVRTTILDHDGRKVKSLRNSINLSDSVLSLTQSFLIDNPDLWSVENPHLYSALTSISCKGTELDRYETLFGIREFRFEADSGFSLNGRHIKINGVNMHHDLGALGTAVNKRAIERQLELLKEMGCNAIRTAHNPPAPELLDLCDEMGFLVIDESFDMWAKRKNRYDYHIFWEDWHAKDLRDMILRDRNHPSVIAWSIGNEIREQFDSTGIEITWELVRIVKSVDDTRPVTCALTEQDPSKNFIYQSGALDIIGFNYKHEGYPDFPVIYPGEMLIASESVSGFATRGYYDMPSDSIRIWPVKYRAPLIGANPEHTASSYDNVHAYWGTTHEKNYRVIKQYPHIAGMFLWSGFDYLGEPTPYDWPSRSSYFGVIDLAGFPKDLYYLYKSEWTDEPVLHIFPHWNWKEGQEVDVWAFYNNADEVELFLNDVSQGIRRKGDSDFHVMWRVNFAPGKIKAVSRKDGQTVLEKVISTAGSPYQLEIIPDRDIISADGLDLSFLTVRIMDEYGNLVPYANNLVRFNIQGDGSIAGVDNGYQASLEPFKADYRKAFNGLCLVIIRPGKAAGEIKVTAESEGLLSEETVIRTRN